MKHVTGGRRPQNLSYTLGCLGRYLGRHRILLALVGVMASVSALASLLGTYMIRPIVNGLLQNGSPAYLAGSVALTAGIYAVGALCTLGYSQLMVRAAQKILREIRGDLFAHLQTLPLQFFDTHRKGDLMSLFHQRRGHRFRRAQQQLCHGHPDLCAGRGHAGAAVCAQLAALAADFGGLPRRCSGTSGSARGTAARSTPASRAAWASSTPMSRR